MTLLLTLIGCYAWSPATETDDSDAPTDTDPPTVAIDCADVGFFGHQPEWDDTGTVVGRITSPSGDIPVAGSTVTVTVGAETAWVVSVDQGCFHVDLPPGEHALTVAKGRYGAERAVTVAAGEVISLGDVRLDDGDVKIALIYGKYDDVGELIGHLGIPSDGFVSPHDLLENPALLNEYDVVFANCGSEASTGGDPYTAVELDSLRSWVESGGTLYASDWEYELIEAVAPSAAYFEADPLIGPEGSITGTLLDRDLIALLGKESVELHYNLPKWAVVRDLGDGTPLVEGRVSGDDRPLALLAHPGAGRAVFTTFHNEEQLGDDMLAVLYQMVLML